MYKCSLTIRILNLNRIFYTKGKYHGKQNGLVNYNVFIFYDYSLRDMCLRLAWASVCVYYIPHALHFNINDQSIKLIFIKSKKKLID